MISYILMENEQCECQRKNAEYIKEKVDELVSTDPGLSSRVRKLRLFVERSDRFSYYISCVFWDEGNDMSLSDYEFHCLTSESLDKIPVEIHKGIKNIIETIYCYEN